MKGYRFVTSFAVSRKVKRWYRRALYVFPRERIVRTLRKRPFVSFFAALLFIFLLILLGTLLTPKPEEEIKTEAVKSVRVFSIGTGPIITTQAQIQKTGVIKIVAQTQGIVQNINVTEGQEVTKGTPLVTLSTNYQGGNAPAIQAQLANEQYRNALETFDTQRELIAKQRDVANKTGENTEELRTISEQSLDQSRSLLNLQNEILRNLPVNDPQIPGVAGAILQLQSSVRSLEYQVNTTNPPTELANLQKDITLKQLDVQEKALSLGKEVSRLQLQLAQVQASLMTPASPSNGVVQRIHVVFGQSVSPGTVIATIFQPEHEIMAVANMSADVASQVSRSEMSTILFGDGTRLKVAPRFVSTEATDGQLYSVLYGLPGEQAKKVTDKEFVTIEVPLAIPDTSSVIPLIPIDAVYKTEEEAYVFVIANGKAVSKTITVGEIFGSYIEVVFGLDSGDMVILDRNVVAGENVIVTST